MYRLGSTPSNLSTRWVASFAVVLAASSVSPFISPAFAQSTSASTSGRPATVEELGFYNPRHGGGSWLTTWNGAVKGEPLNVVISANSDPSVLTYDGFLDYCSSIGFSPQCFNWYDGGSQQRADLGDGNGELNQTTILRYNYEDPIFGTCTQTLQGGNHFRVFRQNGTLAESGAWFLAVSKEHNLGKKHLIIPNGYDLGRDEIVRLATESSGTRSPISKTLYSGTVTAVQGPTYFEDITRNGLNHEISIDGRIAVLTISVLEEGNGKTPSSTWITTITLTEFIILLGIIIFTIFSIGLFCFIHYRHEKLSPAARAPWDQDTSEVKHRGGRKGDEFPLLDRAV